MARPLLPLLLLAQMLALTPAGAATSGPSMSAAEFEAYTTGKTLSYAEAGQPYGVESYLPGRRVVWAFVHAENLTHKKGSDAILVHISTEFLTRQSAGRAAGRGSPGRTSDV